jgi:hypothetical protein
MIHVNLTPSTVFLTIKVITSSTKWYSLVANSFTYVSANQWGTLEQKQEVVKTIGYQFREGVIFTQNCQIPFPFYCFASQ